MAISNALRENWSRMVNDVMRQETILDSTTFLNYDYESDARDSDKVRIITYKDKPVAKWNPATDTGNFTHSAISDQKVEIPLDQFPYVEYRIQGAHQLQINTNAGQALLRNAATQLAYEREKFIAEKMAKGVGADLSDPPAITSLDVLTPHKDGGTPGTHHGFALLDPAANGGQDLFANAVIKAATRMDDYGVPRRGRYLLVPPAFRAFAAKKFDNIGTETNERRIAEGWMGNLYGFEVYMNHFLYGDISDTDVGTGGNTYCVASHPELFTFADQLGGVEVQMYELQGTVRNMGFVVSAQYGGGYAKKVRDNGSNAASEAQAAGAILIQVDTASGTQHTD